MESGSGACDLVTQEEEVEALKAIYDLDFRTLSAERRTYTLRIQPIGGDCHAPSAVELWVMFPVDYPSASPPVYELRAPWLDAGDTRHIAENLERIYNENVGEVVIYQWVEWIREYITQSPNYPVLHETNKEDEEDASSINDTPPPPLKDCGIQCPAILHGEPLTDRKSTFQAHVAAITAVEEVEVVLSELKSNRKIATATHNILAYRLYNVSRGVYNQDYDDDGESAAGGRLLHLLQIMDVRNVMVVVTRWFGGILLHSDRFKHINNVARILLQETGVGQKCDQATGGGKKQKSGSAKSKPGRHR